MIHAIHLEEQSHANNVQKPIVVETGITIQAPLFIKTGEKIKIDTRTGKYMERA